MKKNNQFSIIIPAYNEQENIGKVLSGIKDNLIGDRYEVIVIDDGSTDSTTEVVKKMNGVRLIRHEENKGYGAALKTGIRKANYETVVVIDADGTYPVESIKKMISLFYQENLDMLVGARRGEKLSISFLRKLAKAILSYLANYLTGTTIPDLNSGLRVFKKEIVENDMNIFPDGFSFTITITLLMLTNGYVVKYIPINYYKRKGKSKIRPLRDSFIFFQLIVRIILYFSPLKVFVPISLILFFISILIAIYSIFFTPKFMDTTFTVLVVGALQVLALGLIADLIDKRMR